MGQVKGDGDTSRGVAFVGRPTFKADNTAKGAGMTTRTSSDTHAVFNLYQNNVNRYEADFYEVSYTQG